MKISIISSYNEACGPAFYSARLAHHFRGLTGYDIDVVRLDVSLLRVLGNKKILKKAEAHLSDLINTAKASDVILLQLEPGLYSSYPPLAYKRVLKIVNSINKPTIITVHGFERVTNYGSGLLAALFGLFKGRGLRSVIRGAYEAFSIPKINSFWTKISKNPKVHVVTFCDADARILKIFHDLTKVSTIPISYYSMEEVEEIKKSFPKEVLYKRFGLNPAKKFIAVVGFLGKYKGHKTAISALSELSDEYELLIAGGIHPQGIDIDVELGSYTKELLSHISSIKKQVLQKRIHFLGPLTDSDIELVFSNSDYIVLPYLRTKSGQSASGPAVLAMEFLTSSFYSHSPVFLEYEKYFPSAIRFFDIGNCFELAQKIENDLNVRQAYLQKAKDSLELINPKSMVNSYIAIIQGLKDDR